MLRAQDSPTLVAKIIHPGSLVIRKASSSTLKILRRLQCLHLFLDVSPVAGDGVTEALVTQMMIVVIEVAVQAAVVAAAVALGETVAVPVALTAVQTITLLRYLPRQWRHCQRT